MIDTGSGVLIATICNTIREASRYALWVSDGTRQYVVDLSGYILGPGGLTGIAYRDKRLYVAVQAAETRVLVLDLALNVVGSIVDDRFRELHSLHVAGDALFMASPANGLVLRHDFGTGDTDVVADFGRPSWVAGVHVTADDVWICAHNLSFIDAAAQGGGVYSVRRGQTVLDGLGKPHTLMEYRGGFLVLDSVNSGVVIFDLAGTRHVIRLEGWLRGAAVTEEGRLLVAGGPHRLVSRKNPADVVEQGLRDTATNRLQVFELDDETLTRTYLPEMPGFEIYDLLILPAGIDLTPDEDRIVKVERGMFARLYYAALMKGLARGNG